MIVHRIFTHSELKILILVLIYNNKFPSHLLENLMSVEAVQSFPNEGITYLCDIDGTLLTADGDGYNDFLIDALINCGVTEISLFSSMSANDASKKAEDIFNPEGAKNYIGRDDLIRYLKSKGLKVKEVFTTPDLHLYAGRNTLTVFENDQNFQNADGYDRRGNSFPIRDQLNYLIDTACNNDNILKEDIKKELSTLREQFYSLLKNSTNLSGQYYELFIKDQFEKIENGENITQSSHFKALKIFEEIMQSILHNELHQIMEQAKSNVNLPQFQSPEEERSANASFEKAALTPMILSKVQGENPSTPRRVMMFDDANFTADLVSQIAIKNEWEADGVLVAKDNQSQTYYEAKIKLFQHRTSPDRFPEYKLIPSKIALEKYIRDYENYREKTREQNKKTAGLRNAITNNISSILNRLKQTDIHNQNSNNLLNQIRDGLKYYKDNKIVPKELVDFLNQAYRALSNRNHNALLKNIEPDLIKLIENANEWAALDQPPIMPTLEKPKVNQNNIYQFQIASRLSNYNDEINQKLRSHSLYKRLLNRKERTNLRNVRKLLNSLIAKASQNKLDITEVETLIANPALNAQIHSSFTSEIRSLIDRNKISLQANTPTSTNSSNHLVFSDIDNTLVLERVLGRDTTISLNENLITGWKDAEIHDISFCTSMSIHDAKKKSHEYHRGEVHHSRYDLIEDLQKRGISVSHVFTTPDLTLYAGKQAIDNDEFPIFDSLKEHIENEIIALYPGRTFESLKEQLEIAYFKFYNTMCMPYVMGQYYEKIVLPNYDKAKHTDLSNDPEFQALEVMDNVLQGHFKEDVKKLKKINNFEQDKTLMIKLVQDEFSNQGHPITSFNMFDDAYAIVQDISRLSHPNAPARGTYAFIEENLNPEFYSGNILLSISTSADTLDHGPTKLRAIEQTEIINEAINNSMFIKDWYSKIAELVNLPDVTARTAKGFLKKLGDRLNSNADSFSEPELLFIRFIVTELKNSEDIYNAIKAINVLYTISPLPEDDIQKINHDLSFLLSQRHNLSEISSRLSEFMTGAIRKIKNDNPNLDSQDIPDLLNNLRNEKNEIQSSLNQLPNSMHERLLESENQIKLITRQIEHYKSTKDANESLLSKARENYTTQLSSNPHVDHSHIIEQINRLEENIAENGTNLTKLESDLENLQKNSDRLKGEFSEPLIEQRNQLLTQLTQLESKIKVLVLENKNREKVLGNISELNQRLTELDPLSVPQAIVPEDHAIASTSDGRHVQFVPLVSSSTSAKRQSITTLYTEHKNESPKTEILSEQPHKTGMPRKGTVSERIKFFEQETKPDAPPHTGKKPRSR